jgi:hypothetical protein
MAHPMALDHLRPCPHAPPARPRPSCAQAGKPVRSADAVAAVLSPDFEAVASEDVPFIIREHARKFQWGCSHAVVWRRKGGPKPAAAPAM